MSRAVTCTVCDVPVARLLVQVKEKLDAITRALVDTAPSTVTVRLLTSTPLPPVSPSDPVKVGVAVAYT